MKDLIILWHSLSGRNYSVSANSDNLDNFSDEDDPRTMVSNFRRKSSVVVNRFINAAIPVDADGRQKWSRSK